MIFPENTSLGFYCKRFAQSAGLGSEKGPLSELFFTLGELFCVMKISNHLENGATNTVCGTTNADAGVGIGLQRGDSTKLIEKAID